MAGIRALVATIAISCLLAPAALAADGTEAPAKRSFAPGDLVRFEVPDSRRGDGYRVWVDGRAVAEGTDDTDETGVKDEFKMPDLGGEAREVTWLLQVFRPGDGTDRSYRGSLDYTPRHAAEAPRPASKPSPPRTPNPSPASTPAASPPVASEPLPDLPDETSTRAGGRKPRGSGRVLHRLAQAGPLRSRGAGGGRRKARHHARRRRHKRNRFHPGADPVPPKVRSVSPPRDTRADLSSGGFPGLGYSVAWKLLAAVALAGFLLPLLVGGLARVRRRREAEIEAELQEMIVEYRVDERLPR